MAIDFSFLEGTAQNENAPMKSDTANVTIRVDADSLLLCDGDYIDHPFKAGAFTKIELPAGQHLLEFLSEENPDVKVEKIVDFPEAGKSYLVIVNELKFALAEAADTCIIPEGVEALESKQDFMRYYKGESKVKLPSTLKKIGDNKGYTIFGDDERETRNKYKRQIKGMLDEFEFDEASKLEKFLEKEEKKKIYIEYIDLSRCTKLESIGEKTFSYCYDLSKVILPNSLKKIQSYAFYHCERLREIIIPLGVTAIGKGAFQDCSVLTSIEIPNGVTSIESYTFRNCYRLTSIEIPNSITSIGEGAFQDCCALTTSITIPNGATSIESYTFSNCYSLTSITIPDSVTSIGYHAFRSCRSLTNVTIPNSVKSISESAFEFCSSLEKINIPPKASIGRFAFDGCTKLKNHKK